MGLCLLFMMELIKAVEAPVRGRRRVIESPLEDTHAFPILMQGHDDAPPEAGVRLEIKPLTSLEDMLVLARAAEEDLYGDYYEGEVIWGAILPDLRGEWRSAVLQ